MNKMPVRLQKYIIKKLPIKPQKLIVKEPIIISPQPLKKKKIHLLRGVFYNSQKSMCSIYSSGLMCFQVLKNTTIYNLEYSEEKDKIDLQADFIIINHHPAVCNWISPKLLSNYKGKTFCIITEVGLHTEDPIPVTPKIFDHYIVIDPTIQETKKIHAFPRPLPNHHVPPYIPKDIPVIGSFGFAGFDKRWGLIIECVYQEFDQAIIRFNIPQATFVSNKIYEQIMDEIQQATVILKQKPGIKFELTSTEFETQQDIVNWCAQNTINIFLYNRNTITGLSAVTDQAIISERPLMVSNNPTFRHIHPYISYYPHHTIKSSIENSVPGVLQMKQDWSSAKFLQKFENILLQTIPKQNVLFCNHKKQQCGVYQYGKRVYNILKKCSYISYDYVEVESLFEYKCQPFNRYNAIIYNFHVVTMPWLNQDNIHHGQENIGILHECHVDFFDKIIHIDPDVPETSSSFPIPRPLFEKIPSENDPCSPTFQSFVSFGKESDLPIFGSFGFGFHFKGFPQLVKMINDQYDKAIIKFVISTAYFDNNSNTVQDTVKECFEQNRKQEIILMIHTEFVSEHDLLVFLCSNTMNMFLYEKLEIRGISSALDYALSVKKPFGISDSYMFRHIYHDDICLYKNTIEQCMKNSIHYYEKIISRYHPQTMRSQFYHILTV